MAAILTRDQRKAESSFGPLESMFFQDRAKYHIVRPGTKGPTTVRVYPQFFADGAIAPMIVGERGIDLPDGTIENVLEISNLVQIDTITCQGLAKENYFTGCTSPSDRPSTRFDRVFGGCYIKAKAKKRNPFEAASQTLKDLVTKLTVNREGTFNKPMSAPDETYFVRCAVLVENGTKLPKPVMNGLLILRGTATTAYNSAIHRAHEAGLDLFDPANGYCVTFGALPANKEEGRNTAISTCVRGIHAYNGEPAVRADLEAKAKPQPLAVDVIRKYWTNVEDDIKKFTWRELMSAAVKAYTAEVIEACFPEQYNEFINGSTTKQEVASEDAFATEEPKEEVKKPETKVEQPKEQVKREEPKEQVKKDTPKEDPKPETKTNPEDDMDAAYEAMLAGMK